MPALARHLILPLLATAACAKAQQEGLPGDDLAAPDATPDDLEVDAPPVDAPDDDPPAPDAPAPDAPPAAAPAPLVLTEVAVAPTGAELIELANPTGAPVDLSRYHLADVGTYFRLPAGAAQLDTADFVVRFPAGATLGPGEVIVVALDTAASFVAATGATPDYSIAGGTMTMVASNGTPTLTNAGELVALFWWDGASDLVTDVDLMIVGAPTAANGFVAKGGVAVDGPDPDTTPTAYAAEAATLAAQAAAPGSGASTKRIALEAGFETVGGGNGAAGHDETSEATASTWDATFTAPTPGTTTLPLP